MPGRRTPGGADEQELSATGVAIDATGTTTVGDVEGDRTQVVAVEVTPTAADFDFNVNHDGSPIYDSAQSPAAAEAESFGGQGDAIVVVGATTVEFEVTSASGTGGATADVNVTALGDDQN
jgi:hypothetical protein